MKDFKHINARTVDEAASILKKNASKAKIIAGGTDVLGQMKDNILPEYPEAVVNIKSITGLDYIREEDHTLRIGALTRLEDIAKDKIVKARCNVLAETASKTASPHIREMGTIAGNICQSNRCWYYWNPENRFNCLRKGGKMCYALVGDARYHSIFGGTRINGTPCTVACPANVEIPDYLSKIREGDLAEAARILISYNPLPAITGRVCPHFCEQECNRGEFDEATSIRSVERFLGDYILENAKTLIKPARKDLKKRVAVVGSGPAGLSAAYYLRTGGYEVTVFEAMEEPGGMLLYGIPPYRLPKDVVRRQIKVLEDAGILFKLNIRINQVNGVKDLMNSYDAVFLACGAWKESPSRIHGEDLMLSGIEFLKNSNLGKRELPGQNIAVIGGGNVAIDVARTLIRLGAKPVVIYRRSRTEMPALKQEVDKAEEEGVEFRFLTVPVEVSREGNQVVLKCVKMELGPPDETGRPRPIPITGSEFTIEFEAVFKALGEVPDTAILPSEFADTCKQLRSKPNEYFLGANLFAGGDFVSGAATVVAAISAGRKAAQNIDQFLKGSRRQRKASPKDIQPETFSSESLWKSSRVEAPELPVQERINSPDIEETGGLELKEVKAEANRCFNCGCVAVSSSDLAPTLIALNSNIKTNKRVIKAENFFTVGVNKSTVLDQDEIVTEIEIPIPDANTHCTFTKFAIRKSIDFPVVNCAAAVESENGVVKHSRICLNSVYNQPYRVAGAEDYINGRKIDASIAEEAAAAGISAVCPLINNRYKIQIARTLVKRAILACKPNP